MARDISGDSRTVLLILKKKMDNETSIEAHILHCKAKARGFFEILKENNPKRTQQPIILQLCISKSKLVAESEKQVY